MALPARDHHIPLAEAAALTKRHRDANPKAARSGAFHADQVIKLLSQPGCVALRIYYGLAADGTPNLILTGMDANGADLTGEILEKTYPCPPFCDAASPLNG